MINPDQHLEPPDTPDLQEIEECLYDGINNVYVHYSAESNPKGDDWSENDHKAAQTAIDTVDPYFGSGRIKLVLDPAVEKTKIQFPRLSDYQEELVIDIVDAAIEGQLTATKFIWLRDCAIEQMDEANK